ncbi:hypothetical protein [uncultured Tateyamaria sp.]|uniref:hypothetical protein n=1 Tax=uncultured Tateyamaria sp. TaxID=455651 RepID=UPI0026042232|nr:hypothetical protein [uncultured Tateyamaria sp.]
MTETLSLNYTVDDVSARDMLDGMMPAPAAMQRLSKAASISLSAIAMIIGMLTGFAISFYAGLGDIAFAILPIGLGIGCVVACYAWARRVNMQVRQSQMDVMRPGSPVSYTFDNSGLHLTTWCQNWQTSWAGVTEVRTSDKGLVIMCGLVGFAIPRAGLGDQPDETSTQITNLWTQHK